MMDKVLKAISSIAGVGLVLSVCSLDSDTYIPHVIAIGCLAWLCIYFFVLGGGSDGTGKAI